MAFVASTIGVGQKRHTVTLTAPTATAPDGDGGYVTTYGPLTPPTLNVSIRTAGPTDIERLSSGTISAMATHVLVGDYHPQITTQTIATLQYGPVTRRFSVVGLGNPNEGRAQHELLCAEQVE